MKKTTEHIVDLINVVKPFGGVNKLTTTPKYATLSLANYRCSTKPAKLPIIHLGSRLNSRTSFFQKNGSRLNLQSILFEKNVLRLNPQTIKIAKVGLRRSLRSIFFQKSDLRLNYEGSNYT